MYFLTSADGNGRPPFADLDIHVYLNEGNVPICTLALTTEGIKLERYFYLSSGGRHIETTVVIPWDRLTMQEEP